jgi:DNA ligase-3
MSDNRYSADRGKRPAKCQKCKQQIGKGELRLAKLTANPFTGDGEMKQYHHPNCLFETFKKARSTTRIIEDVEDIEEYRYLDLLHAAS